MARLFLSHSSANDAKAMALHEWLSENGYRGDLFLDIDPDAGLTPGERWQEALRAAADRCEAVLILLSPDWLQSHWCLAEYLYAKSLNKRIFGILIEDVPLAEIPDDIISEWQLSDLTKRDGAFLHYEMTTRRGPRSVDFPAAGLALLLRGLRRAGLDANSFPWPPPDDPARAPYRGLRALEPRDAAVFFGRETAIVQGLDQIRGLKNDTVDKTFVILGASGSGKSSFLRAGLWPRLARMDTAFLPLPILRPELEPIHGASGLIAVLSDAFKTLGSIRSREQVAETIESGGADPLGGLFDELLAMNKTRVAVSGQDDFNAALVVCIDQAEELFEPEAVAESDRLFELLGRSFRAANAVGRRQIVVVTIRSDRYELLQSGKQIAHLRRELFDLPPIPVSEYKSVVEGPIRRINESGRRFDIDPHLTEALIHDARGADALPLLAFTLEHLYTQFGHESRLTLEHYVAFGRVQGSIEAAVKQALANPDRPPAIPADPEAQSGQLRAAFIPWLIRIDPNTDSVSRRVARVDEIPETSRAVVERLVDFRLLIGDRRNGVDVIEVAHESLLRQWSQLAVWVDADHADLKAIEGVIAAAGEWERNDRLPAWLDHRAERLANADALSARPDFHRRLEAVGVAYLTACRASEEAERRAREEALTLEQARLEEISSQQQRTARAQKRARRFLVAMAAAVVVGIGVFAWEWVALGRQQVNLLAEVAATQRLGGNFDGALRLAARDVQLEGLDPRTGVASAARAELSAAYFRTDWRLSFGPHGGAVRSVAFSADGKRIVTASDDKQARIWDADTAASLRTFIGHEGPVTSAAFDRAGTRIVTASEDNTARIWNAANGEEYRNQRLIGHAGPVWSADFDSDGKRILTASSDATARIWDASTGKILLVLKGHEGPVWHAAFSADGTKVVTASEDGTARVWDAATGKPIGDPLRGHAGGVWTAAFDKSGKRVVTASYDTFAYVWDLEHPGKPHKLDGHQDWVMSAAFNDAGTRVVTGSQDGTARLWNVEVGDENAKPGDDNPRPDENSFKEVGKLQGHEGGVLSVAFNGDGTKVLTASFDRTARLWDTTTGTPLKKLEGHTDKVWSAAFSPDGKKVVTASQDNTARIFDAETEKTLLTLEGHSSWVMYAAFSSDGHRVVTASQDGTARIWDADTGEPLQLLRGHEGGVMMAEFNTAGTRVVTASYDRTARVWDTASGKELLAFRGHATGVLSAAFSVDGERVVSSAYDQTAKIWDADTGRVFATLRGHTGGVWDAHFNPDGSRVVTASEDRTARIWDSRTGKELVVLRGHEDWIWSALFSPDGKRVVTGSQDKTARIWDAATGLEIGVIREVEVERGIYFATFGPDGTRIVTASEDGTASIWDASTVAMKTKDLRNDICARRLGNLSTLTPDEMRLAGDPIDGRAIDVCATGQ